MFKKVIGDNLGKKYDDIGWPPQTPEAAPCDYSVNHAIHTVVAHFCRAVMPANKTELKEFIVEAFEVANQNRDYLSNVVGGFLPRIRTIIERDGVVHPRMLKRRRVQYGNTGNSDDADANNSSSVAETVFANMQMVPEVVELGGELHAEF